MNRKDDKYGWRSNSTEVGRTFPEAVFYEDFG
jgi:hypothetical protein